MSLHKSHREVAAYRTVVATGLALVIFSVVALSGPGRIDIVDGQTRYEVSRSIIDHGDHVIRNPDVWFGVFPGRGQEQYTYYRFPQSFVGAIAILIADITGPRREARRHFFFSLTSAAAVALLSVVYLSWFSRRGLSTGTALYWAATGILCTPSWFYGTSSFDEALGTLVATAAIAASVYSRSERGSRLHFAAGLLFGLAFNCKQPLGAFVLAGLVAGDDRFRARRQRLGRAALMVCGLLVGIAVYALYHIWKFPTGTAHHEELLKQYYPVFTSHSSYGLAALALLLSPAAGAIWYFPPVLLCADGVRRYAESHPRLALALLASLTIFIGFICSISFFKGDPAWGPRYLTPAFAILWLFSVDGARRFRPAIVRLLLALGLAVQCAALALDPYRLYIQRDLPSVFGAVAPILYFDPANSHLLNRPRELIEVWRARTDPGVAFTPWQVPTGTPTVIDREYPGPANVARYKVLNSFRPWWASHHYIAAADRPVSVPATVGLLLTSLVSGLALVATGSSGARSWFRGTTGKSGRRETNLEA